MAAWLTRVANRCCASCTISVLLLACAGKTGSGDTGAGGASGDTGSLTGTSTGTSSASGGATGKSTTGFATGTAIAGCVTRDAGACDMTSILPLPSVSNVVKIEFTESCYGVPSRTKGITATTEATKLRALYEATLTGLATRGGTSCTTSCPPSTVNYRLVVTLDDGRILFVHLVPNPGLCGSVTVEGTNCSPPVDPNATFGQVVSIFELDAGIGMSNLTPINCDTSVAPDAW